MLLAAGAEVNKRVYNGLNALMIAKNRDCPEIVSLLMEAGAMEDSFQGSDQHFQADFDNLLFFTLANML